MAFIVERNPATVPQLKVKLKDAPVYVGLPERVRTVQEDQHSLAEAKTDGREVGETAFVCRPLRSCRWHSQCDFLAQRCRLII